MTKIFIPEEIPSLNKGEAAILIGALESFRTLGDVEVSLLSFRPEIDRMRYPAEIKIIDGMKDLHLSNTLLWGPPIAKIARIAFCAFQHISFGILHKIFGSEAIKIMKGEIWREYTQSDLIIVGHDNTIIIPAHLYTIPLAKLLRKPVVIYAGGTKQEGVGNKLWTMLARLVLNKVDLISLRDEISYTHLQKIGIKPPMYVTADTAFLLPSAPPERVKEIMSRENINKNRPIIGMVMRGTMFHYTFPCLKNPKQKYDKCVRVMAQVVDYMVDTLNATVVFIPHSFDPAEGLDDKIIAKDIYQIAKNKLNIKVITNEYAPEELKGLIGQFDLFISARTHPLISSATMYVTFITISCPSHQRAYGIIGEMLGQEKWICDVEMLDSDVLISKITDAWFARGEIKKDLMSKVEIVKESALYNGELVKDLLMSL